MIFRSRNTGRCPFEALLKELRFFSVSVLHVLYTVKRKRDKVNVTFFRKTKEAIAVF